MLPTSQEEINLDFGAFRERFGENPRKDDLTILVPRQDDPTEQVCVDVLHEDNDAGPMHPSTMR